MSGRLTMKYNLGLRKVDDNARIIKNCAMVTQGLSIPIVVNAGQFVVKIEYDRTQNGVQCTANSDRNLGIYYNVPMEISISVNHIK